MPGTCAASAAARDRAGSLLTVPLRVATCFWTEDWMDSVLRAPSPAIRLWRAAVRLASSVEAGDGELLHPATAKAMVRAVAARMARELERFLLTYICPFLRKTLA